MLLDLFGEHYYGVSEAGALIVGKLTTTSRESAMVALRAQLVVDPAVLQAGVDALIGQLISKGLLIRGTAE